MANKVVIDVEARFVDNVSDESKAAEKAIGGIGKEADKAQKKVDQLSKKKAKPIFDVDNNKFLNKIRSMEDKMRKLGRTKTAAVLHAVDKATSVIGKVMNKGQAFGRSVWQGTLKFKDSDALTTVKKLTSGVENLTKKTWTTMVNIKDMALAPIKAIKNALFSIPTLITTVIGAKVVQETVIKPINLADQYSSAKIGFSTLLGDSRGQAMMDEIDLFAKKTPFKTSGVISNAQKMMAYGWDVERVIDDMEIIGDAAAATGKGDQGLESIVRALAEIRSKGKLSTQELNQLAGAGIKAKGYLAEGLGYGTSDAGMKLLAEDLEKGAIGANQAIELILLGMKEFDGMMDRTANETVEGLKSQIEDAFEINIFRRWGQGLQDGAKRGFGGVVKLLDEADTALDKFGDLLYEIGNKASNWLADKFENAIDRIMTIMDSYEFKNASMGEKVSMLWKGVVADPMKEWWDGGGKEKMTKTAQDIGRWLGEAIMDGIKFAWNAMPLWGKILVGAYAGGKMISGAGNVIGGLTNILGGAGKVIGSTGVYGIGGSGVLGGLSKLGYGTIGMMGTKASASLLGLGGGTAALAGAGTIAAAAATGKGLYDLYGSISAFRKGDKIEGKAKAASGGSAIGGTLAGAAAGAAIGSVIPIVGTAAGALIGAGIGGISGWIGGNKWATSIREAKYEVEGVAEALEKAETEEEKLAKLNEAAWENMRRHMGDVKLSADEIKRLADQIIWGEDLGQYDQFTAASKQADASMQSLKSSSEDLSKWMWKAGLGVKFNKDELEALTASFDDYISSSKSYLENKHYEFSSSVGMLVGSDSEGGKSILESGNAFYGKLQKQLDDLGGKLSKYVNIALSDSVITLDEQKEIINLQNQISSITEKISNAETKAELELIRLKFGKGNLDLDSFDNFMKQMETTLSERMAANDTAFKASVSSLELQLEEGAIDQEEYNRQLGILVGGYEGKVENIKAQIMGVELDIISEAYGIGKGRLQEALEKSLKDNLNPIDWTPEEAAHYLGIPGLAEDTALAISKMLGGVANQLELVVVDGKLLLDLGIETEENTEEQVKNAVDKAVPDRVNTNVDVNITGNKIMANKFSLSAADWGIKTSYTFTPTLNVKGRVGSFYAQYSKNGSGYRGGIFGGTSAMEGFALGGRPDDGMLKGSTRFIRVNEESPEMIIPLSSQRRNRALKLWAKAGNIMGVPGFARGGMTSGGNDEGIRFRNYGGNDSAGERTVQVDIGGITFEISVNGNDPHSITEAIKAQASEIAETVAGVLADALGQQFENTPARGGVA